MHRVVNIRFPPPLPSRPEFHTPKFVIQISERAFCRYTKMLEHICFCEKYILAFPAPQNNNFFRTCKNTHPNHPRAIHTCTLIYDTPTLLFCSDFISDSFGAEITIRKLFIRRTASSRGRAALDLTRTEGRKITRRQLRRVSA